MAINAPWNDRLAEPFAKDHLVQVYKDDRVLVEAVALFAAGGLGKGEAVVLVATPDHLEAIESFLGIAGFELNDLAGWGQLRTFDAASLLATFLVDGRIHVARFHATLAGLFAAVRADGRFGRIRVYGEMVNLLWRHNHEATRQLEELWNEAIQAHSLSLLCGYRIGGGEEPTFPADLQAPHSHFIPLDAGA